MSRQPTGPTMPLTRVDDTSAYSRGGISSTVAISGIDVADGAFVFVVRSAADAAHDVARADAVGIVDEELVFVGIDAHVGKGRGDVFEHFAALGDGVGGFFVGIGDDEFVEERLRFAYHPQVAVGRRVEAAGIHGAAQGFGLHIVFGALVQLVGGRAG